MQHSHEQVRLLSPIVVGFSAAVPLTAARFDGSHTAFADPRFPQISTHSDADELHVERGTPWGPNAWLDDAECGRDSPIGLRTLPYVDKAGIELNRSAGQRTGCLPAPAR